MDALTRPIVGDFVKFSTIHSGTIVGRVVASDRGDVVIATDDWQYVRRLDEITIVD